MSLILPVPVLAFVDSLKEIVNGPFWPVIRLSTLILFFVPVKRVLFVVSVAS